MTVITVELIDPRVKALLEDLAKMNLIKIREEETSQNRFSKLLTKLRSTEEEVSYSRKPVLPT
jgi:hypothetical protein